MKIRRGVLTPIRAIPGQSPSQVSETAPTIGPSWGQRFAANLFFLFFVAQILSPSFFGVTIYVEVLVAVATPGFWRWVAGLRPPDVAVVAVLGLAVVLGVTRPATIVELISISTSVLYLAYCHINRTFFLFRYLLVSIGFAVAQAALLQVNAGLAFDIGPRNIATVIWGSHATATNSNFYVVLAGIDRVSGLSREAGFFAALIVASAVVFILDRSGLGKTKAVTLSTAWVLSLSKISLAGPPLFLVLYSRRALDTVPRVMVVAIYFFAVDYLAHVERAFLLSPGNDTFLHRFGANLALGDLTTHQLLFGADLPEVHSEVTQRLAVDFTQAAGLSGFMVRYGLIVFIMVFLVLMALGARGAALAIVCIGTLNVDPMTSQNFVVLIYFVALYLLPRYSKMTEPAREMRSAAAPETRSVGAAMGSLGSRG